MNKNIYLVNASSRLSSSNSRKLTAHLVNRMNRDGDFSVSSRDVGAGEGLNLLDDVTVSGLFIPNDQRSAEQQLALESSDQIVQEALDNDIWVIGLPIYNFSVPASFKAWADMLARSNKTFKYLDGKPVGLLRGKLVFVILISGGTEMDSEINFCTPWLRQFMSFIGIGNLEIINATKFAAEREFQIIEDINSRLRHYGF